MNFLSRNVLLITTALCCLAPNGFAQPTSPSIRYGAKVPADVRLIYERGLRYLAQSQQADGSWAGNGQPGITGMAIMAFLASGEDPNFGQYSLQIRKGVRSIVQGQNQRTGYFGSSMYHHGFAMLGLSEAYGAVDEALIWGSENGPRSIAKALELGVRCSVTAQKKNSWGGWRYGPDDNSADTSVSGAVLMGLLAVRNAGIKVPDTCIDRALKYFRNSTSKTGMVAYSGGVGGFGESMNRSSIGTLVFAIGKQKKWDQYKSALNHITTRLEHQEGGYPFYFRYYMAQALFQGDFDAWKKWNRETVRQLKGMQADNGSFQGGHGQPYATSMSLLALALNYRFLPIYER